MIKFDYEIPGKVYHLIFSDDDLSIRIRMFNESVKHELTNFHYANYMNCFYLFKWLLKLKRKSYKIEYYEYSENDILLILKELQEILIKK